MPKIFQRSPGGNYYIRLYRDNSEKWMSLHTSSKREAEKRAGRLQYGHLPQLLQAVVDKPKTPLSDIWKEYSSTAAYRALKPSSLESKIAAWMDFERNIGIKYADDLSPAICAKYLEKIIKETSSSTGRHRRTTLSSIWSEIAHRFPGLSNPWKDLPKTHSEGASRHTGAFTPAQVSSILKALRLRDGNWLGMVLISLHTGLRLKDVVYLRHEQAANGVLVVLPAKTERKGRSVHIPIHPSIQGYFHAGEGFLWPEEVERYEKSRQYHGIAFASILKDIGIKSDAKNRCGFHSLRATFITEMEKAGVERRSIQSAVGHRSGQQTAEYSDLRMTAEEASKINYNIAKP